MTGDMNIEKQKNGLKLEILLKVLNNLNAVIFANKSETCEVVYVNARMKEQFGVEDYTEDTLCHKYFHGKNERCDFCPYSKLRANPEEIVTWKLETAFHKIYNMSALLIDWPEIGEVHFEFGIEVTESEQHTEMMKNVLNGMDALITLCDAETFEVLPNTDKRSARILAEKMLGDIENLKMPHRTSKMSDCITVSIGAVSGRIGDSATADEFVKQADEMLYESKRNGRNRCEFAEI